MQDAAGLATFAQGCKATLCLLNSTGLLPSLNEPTATDLNHSIVSRLNTGIFYKWCEYKADRRKRPVQRKGFVQWLNGRANLELGINSKKVPTTIASRNSTKASTVATNNQGQINAKGPWRGSNTGNNMRSQRFPSTCPLGIQAGDKKITTDLKGKENARSVKKKETTLFSYSPSSRDLIAVRSGRE